MKKKQPHYARMARECAKELQERHGTSFILLLIVLVRLEPWLGTVDPRELELDHMLTLLCFGAAVLDAP